MKQILLTTDECILLLTVLDMLQSSSGLTQKGAEDLASIASRIKMAPRLKTSELDNHIHASEDK